MEPLLPDRLKELWQRVDRGEMTAEAAERQQAHLLDEYRRVWADALILDGCSDLRESLLTELGSYLGEKNLEALEIQCRRAVADLKSQWHHRVSAPDRPSVERFYDESQAMLHELMWWHTLTEDHSPLAYVLALDYVRRHGCRTHLDFGAGVGSGTILFARHGFDVALADISAPLRHFCQWRLARRGLTAMAIDLKTTALPHEAFDIITAMDVFEHLVDPVGTVETLWRALRPGGFLFARFGCEPDDEHPMHIVTDFTPTLNRLQELGGAEVWRDEWLWGHQVFQKAPVVSPQANVR